MVCMDSVEGDGFSEFEAQWIEASEALARRRGALDEAMRAYRQHSPACRPARVAQAIGNQDEAREDLKSLMHAIWAKLF